MLFCWRGEKREDNKKWTGWTESTYQVHLKAGVASPFYTPTNSNHQQLLEAYQHVCKRDRRPLLAFSAAGTIPAANDKSWTRKDKPLCQFLTYTRLFGKSNAARQCQLHHSATKVASTVSKC